MEGDGSSHPLVNRGFYVAWTIEWPSWVGRLSECEETVRALALGGDGAHLLIVVGHGSSRLRGDEMRMKQVHEAA